MHRTDFNQYKMILAIVNLVINLTLSYENSNSNLPHNNRCVLQ